MLKIYFFFDHLSETLNEKKSYKLLIRSETPKQSVNFLLENFPNKQINLQIVQVARKFANGDVNSIRLIGQDKVLSKIFLHPCLGANCFSEKLQDPTKLGEQILVMQELEMIPDVEGNAVIIYHKNNYHILCHKDDLPNSFTQLQLKGNKRITEQILVPHFKSIKKYIIIGKI